MTSFDVIVIGVGGMGSAACLELAGRKRRVLGLEQFPLVHARGSSHGQTRIIRTAYYEHPNYVPLLRHAFARWRYLEKLSGRTLLTACPCLNIGPVDGELVNGVRASVKQHRLVAEELSASDIAKRFPFRFPENYAGVMEQQAGYLFVEDCVKANIDTAVSLGAKIHAEEPVHEWKVIGDSVEVTTSKGTYRAAKLIVTAGAWATKLLADLGVPLTVMRQVMCWFDVSARPGAFKRGNFPIFIADVPEGPFYGLPAIDASGLKLARHYGQPELPNPDGVNWNPDPTDEPPVRDFLNKYVSAPVGPLTRAVICMYTLTPDKHFVIDLHPRHPQVAVACGFSGHGFKFAPVVGEILANLAETGRTPHPIELFKASRFQAKPL